MSSEKKEENNQIIEESNVNNTIDESNFESVNDFKPRKWLLIVLIILALAIAVVLINKLIMIYNERKNNREPFSIFNIFENNNFNADFFNTSFEHYTGTQSRILTLSLLDEIITNNKKEKNHILTVIFKEHSTTDPNEIKNIKSELDSYTEYEVSIDYDEKGYAEKITIEPIEKNTSSSFNRIFEMYAGTKNGISAGWFLDEVITNNKTNKNHLLTVVFKNHNTTDPEEIKNIKKELDDWTNYEISLDYDEKGYANKVTIEE